MMRSTHSRRASGTRLLDADIKDFFDSISHERMMRFVEHRIGDRRVLRLIRGWLKAGVVEDGILGVTAHLLFATARSLDIQRAGNRGRPKMLSGIR
jgi:hypothetical protein